MLVELDVLAGVDELDVLVEDESEDFSELVLDELDTFEAPFVRLSVA